MHEMKQLVAAYSRANKEGKRAVMATVVALDGSSYRRPGVRMLIREDGIMVGAVSGGCVEKEIYRRATRVFDTGIPEVMVYDGRYRLGCEGILYILIEPFGPEAGFTEAFDHMVSDRIRIESNSYYTKAESVNASYGTILWDGTKKWPFYEGFTEPKGFEQFRMTMDPCLQLVLIGGEHDAVHLTSLAALTGWEVTVVTDPRDGKSMVDFPGAHRFIATDHEAFPSDLIDGHTVVMLMTHSYVKDLGFLIALRRARPAYLGLLGPARRREKLLGDLLERFPDMDPGYLSGIYAPAGLDLGAETPQEVGIAILAEILSTLKQRDPRPLRERIGPIHEPWKSETI